MSRIITGLTAAAIWCLILYIDSLLLLWGTITLIAVAAVWEYISITLKDEPVLFKTLTVLFGSFPILLSFSNNFDLIAAGLVAGFILNCTFTVFAYSRLTDPFKNLVHGGLILIYVSFCASFLVMTMSLSDGALLLLLLTAITATADSGAYFIGMSLGRRELAINLSPSKTVAGLVGGFLSGLAAALIVGLSFLPDRSLVGILLSSFLLVGLGTIGDLTESIIKRDQMVKDSGSLFPGHGGLLDRFDSLLLSGPLFYYLVHWGVI